MSEGTNKAIGSITWTDLTVTNTNEVKDFYNKVVGWKPVPFDMGGYSPESGKTVAGICHSQGINAGLPPQWLIYITVENVDQSAKHCTQLGGKLIIEPKNMGSHGRYCVIEDPAGAVAALFESAK